MRQSIPRLLSSMLIPLVCLRMIEVVALVLEYRSLRKNSEAMGETSGNKELAMIILCQFHGNMLSVSRGAFMNIHGYIKHSTFYTSHQLTPRKRRSQEIQASHHTLRTHALVVLAELYFVAHQWFYLIFKLTLAEALEELTTSITKEAWFNNNHVLYICLNYVYFFIIVKHMIIYQTRRMITND